MFRNVFRLLLVLAAFVVVRYLIYAVRKAVTSTPPRGATKSASGAGERLYRDPVCGAFVPADGALTASAGGVTHHFCSAICRDKFLTA